MLEYQSHYAMIEYGEYSSTNYGARNLTEAMRAAIDMLDYYRGIAAPIRRLVVGEYCPVCSGDGRIRKSKFRFVDCRKCGGTGHVNEQALPIN